MTIDPLLVPTILSLCFQGTTQIISQIQHSRCTSIRGCGLECIRQVPPEQNEEPASTEQAPAVSPRRCSLDNQQ